MVDVRKLIEYNEEVRHRYFDALVRLSWNELIKNREASFHSIRNIFIHILDATDYWLDFLLHEHLRTKREFDDYKTKEDVQKYMERVEARMRTYSASLNPKELLKEYELRNDSGRLAQVTAEDVLIHVFEEEVHHRGELIALLWQMGIEPPLMGWKYL